MEIRPNQSASRCLLAIGLALCAPAPSAPAQDGEATQPFKHTLHVSPEWLGRKETKRDCRGCHDYQNGVDPSVPRCRQCHYLTEQRRIFPAAGFAGFAALRDENSAFRHKFHLSLDCKSCHNPLGGLPGSPPKKLSDKYIPGDMPIPLGAGVCMRCHDPESEVLPPSKRPPDLLERHVAGLNRRAPKKPDRFAGFRHGDHLSEADLTNPATCEQPCHVGVPKSNAWSLTDNGFTIGSCGECHRTDQGEVRLEVARRKKESRSAACFTHEPHLSPKARAEDENIKEHLCLACHDYNKQGGTYDLKEIFGTYDSCVQCHAHQSWKIADHGEVDDCRGCHTIGQGDMKTNRPRVEIERPRPLAFRIERQAHPFITGPASGATNAPENCGRCHVARFAALPSRIGSRKFSHKTHLPATPAAKDCEPCHADVAKTKGPEEIDTTFSLAVCKDCHKVSEVSAEIQAVYPEKVDKRSVIAFPHAQHIDARGPDGETYTCLSCHEPDTSDPTKDVGAKPAAFDCSLCHDHDENFRVTANRDRKYVESCTRCHTAGVPRKGETVVVERMTVTRLLDVQHHPDNTSCKKCHQVAIDELIKVAREHDDHFFGETLLSGKYHFIKTDGYEATPKWTDCLCCHWGQQKQVNRRPEHFQSGSRGPAYFRPILGDDVGSYPGKGCRSR